MDVAEALQTLFEFLHGLLPADVATAALALVPVVVALVRLLRLVPAVETHRRWAAPALALVLGLVAGFTVAPGDWRLAVPAGLLVGLAAIGGWSGARNVAQAVQQPAEGE